MNEVSNPIKPKTTPLLYEFDRFRVDVEERVLLCGGNPVPLTPKVFDTLLLLLENNGHALEKRELMNAIWPESFVEEVNLAHNISVLRKVLGESSKNGKFIETIPKRGYRFSCEFGSQRNGLEPETTKRVVSMLPRSFTVFLIVGSLITAIGLGYYYFGAKGTVPVADVSKPIESIAVLPFANESGDANFDYLSDGMSERLIDRLAQLPRLKVIARNSSFKYRGNNLDLQAVGTSLGVRAIVTGRIVQRGESLSVRVELIDLLDDRQLWSDSYDRRAADAQAVQSEIARTVSEKLRLRLTGTQEQQLAKRETTNPLAYEMLLKGRYYNGKTGPNASIKGLEYFNQAIALDPNYARAYVGLSSTYRLLAANGLLDPKEAMPKAEAAAFKALELDENLAEAHVAVANLKRNAWQWVEAEPLYYRALELNPNLLSAHSGFSQLLSYSGRHEQAVAEAKRARELDPLMPQVNVNLGQTLYFARRYDEALEAAEKALELNQDFLAAYGYLGDIYSAKGMHAEAIAAYQKLGTPTDENPPIDFIYLGAIYARAGERKKAAGESRTCTGEPQICSARGSGGAVRRARRS